MLIEIVKALFNRDLNRLSTEIASYKNQKTIWITDKDIANFAGNLCLHLIGNLNAFIGAQLGKTGYIRNRENEFSLEDIPQDELISSISKTIVVVNDVLDKMTAEDLAKEYPVTVFNEKTTTGFFLVHLTTHLAYHLGQINYHRRLLDNQL